MSQPQQPGPAEPKVDPVATRTKWPCYPPAQPNQYPGPPPAYNAPVTGATTVVMTQPVIAVTQMYRETPVRTKCQFCNADIVTSTTYTTGTFTWVVCLILCFVGCDLGCCLIPFCVNSCKDCIHTCPNCKQQLGVYRRM